MNKPTFRALREEVGVSHADLAHLLQVHPSSVKRWEDESYTHTAPPFAIEFLTNALAERDRYVENELTRLEDGSKSEPVTLNYTRNPSPLAKIQNANNRALYKELKWQGFDDVTFIYTS